MSQDISYHPFKAFPKWHAYYVERKCAFCLQVRNFPLHQKEPKTLSVPPAPQEAPNA